VKGVLLDTGFIVALLDRSERHHRGCRELIGGVQVPLVTCEAVIAEACYVLRRLRGASDAVLANVERGNFVVPFRLDESARAVRTLMKRYASVPMDLADACLVQLATVLDIGDVLTLDDDFHVYRFGRARPFRLLPERA